MLKTLYIKGYALIEELSIDFGRGLNIITGETGAGKSILIDALSLILGERSDVSMVRKGAEKAIVEAQFDHPDITRLNELLLENEIDPSDTLILRREVSLKGQGRCFINDTPATLAVLKEMGDMLVDLHGQHEHQSLLRVETHIAMLDNFGSVGALLDEYREAYRAALSVLNNIDDLQSKEKQLAERRELYEFQLNEIDALSPEAGEEDKLESELKILENAENLHAITEKLYQSLYDGENAVHDQLVIARNQLEDLSAIDGAFQESKGELNSAVAIVSELAKFIQAYNSKIEFNPERLEEIRTRLGSLTLLKKKYGGSLDSVIAHRTKIAREVELAQNFQEEIARLQSQFVAERKKCSELAFRLSTKRQEAAKKIEKAIVLTLAELGIAKGRFEVIIRNNRTDQKDRAMVVSGKDAFTATMDGIDDVEFYISTNVGEDLKPLVKVASGGEVSRIMLSLKKILSKTAKLPLMIFDEIDVGVSGRVAQAVGQNLKNLSQFHQVIAITHLPQIAGFSDLHFAVEKSEEKNRVSTSVRKLTDKERVVEVARLMSGETVTEAAMKGARELMGK